MDRDPLLSRWKIGWRTPTLIISSFSVATIIACIHLGLFRYLDGKEATGPHQIISQSYVSTLSNILVTIFQFALQLSLGTASVQYLWYLLRVHTFRVSAIENLFSMRASPFALFHLSTIRSSPLLVCLAVLIWTIYFSTSFPPGAITIESEKQTIVVPKIVPTFNASFVGNGSFLDADLYTLDNLNIGGVEGGSSTMFAVSTQVGVFQPALQRMADSIIVSGAPFSIPSVCGANCSYNITVDAPWLQCNTSSVNLTIEGQARSTIYDAYWVNSGYPGQQFLTVPNVQELQASNGSNTSAAPAQNFILENFVNSFHTSTLSVAAVFNSGNALVTQHNMTCAPARASYTIQNIYENNVQTMNTVIGPNERLTNINSGINVTVLSGSDIESTVTQWTPDNLAWYRDVNLMALIGVTLSSLTGSYVTYDTTYTDSESYNSILQGAEIVTGGIAWEDWGDLIYFVAPKSYGPLNGTLIANSQMNKFLRPVPLSFSPIYQKLYPPIGFNVTEESLNSLLLNVTLSAITAYGFWNTETNTSIDSLTTVYRFSKPENLLLPYGLTLLFAFPFVFLGLWALNKNGVSAIDGGFIQLVSTSAGSSALRKEAIKGCLGGHENIPEGLRQLQVRFGELKNKCKYEISGQRRKVGRAGFGIESEVVPLTKGADYGSVDEKVGSIEWV